MRRLLCSLLLGCGLAPGVLIAQDAGSPAEVPARAELAPDDVASVDGHHVSLDAFHVYLGTASARTPTGRAALELLHQERLIEAAAARAQLRIDPAWLDELVRALEARAGSSLSAMRSDPTFEASLTRLGLQVRLLMVEQGITLNEALEPETQRAWLAEAAAITPLVEAPLDDAVAAHYDGGQIFREELGARLDQLLPESERAGLLTELLGVLIIHARARALELEPDPEVAVAILAEREQFVAAQPELVGVSYADVLLQTEGLTTAELVASPKFAAEVLLVQMVDQQWHDEALEGFFESERALFEARLGEGVSFEAARGEVLREVRRRSYQKLMHDSTIERRF